MSADLQAVSGTGRLRGGLGGANLPDSYLSMMHSAGHENYAGYRIRKVMKGRSRA